MKPGFQSGTSEFTEVFFSPVIYKNMRKIEKIEKLRKIKQQIGSNFKNSQKNQLLQISPSQKISLMEIS